MTPPPVVRNHVSKESGVVLVPDFGKGRKLFGRSTTPVVPLKLRAWPTLPATYVTPPTAVPLWPPIVSLALPSPRYKLVRLVRKSSLVLSPPLSVTVRSTP